MHSLKQECKFSCQNKGGAKLKGVQNFVRKIFLAETKSLTVRLIFLFVWYCDVAHSRLLVWDLDQTAKSPEYGQRPCLY